jgi:hypothetical protein
MTTAIILAIICVIIAIAFFTTMRNASREL